MLILTFLGKGGTGRSTLAIAAAQQLANQGKRVLLLSQEAGPSLATLLGGPVTSAPTATSVAEGAAFDVVQQQTTDLLENNWEKLKAFEARYLRDPFFKAVYGQELSVVPGMDDFFALNAIREYAEAGEYDVLVHDGSGDQASLRMWGAIEGVDWYFRRFKKVLQDSQFYRSISPFITPIAGAVLTNGLSGDVWSQPETQSIEATVAKGKAMVRDPAQLRAYVVTTADELAIAQGKYLWSAAQQIGLTIAGAWVNAPSGVPLPEQPDSADALAAARGAFAPLAVTAIPFAPRPNRWQPILEALPNLTEPPPAPAALTVETASNSVRLFLPGFDKSQVKLTQYGPEVTVEAGDQRQNLALPPALSGRAVTGAKFQEGYLIISFG